MFIRGIGQPANPEAAGSTSDGSTVAPAAPASTATPWYATLASSALQAYQTVQFSNVQAKRAAAGLPPLTAAQYGAQYIPPAATVNVGIAPQTQSIMNWILIGAGVLAVVLVVGAKKL